MLSELTPLAPNQTHPNPSNTKILYSYLLLSIFITTYYQSFVYLPTYIYLVQILLLLEQSICHLLSTSPLPPHSPSPLQNIRILLRTSPSLHLSKRPQHLRSCCLLACVAHRLLVITCLPIPPIVTCLSSRTPPHLSRAYTPPQVSSHQQPHLDFCCFSHKYPSCRQHSTEALRNPIQCRTFRDGRSSRSSTRISLLTRDTRLQRSSVRVLMELSGMLPVQATVVKGYG